MAKPMTEEELHDLAKLYLREQQHYADDTLTENWDNAYGFDKGELPGATADTDSTYQATDVSDTIEWILPSVLKEFIQSPDVVRFDPINPEDEAQADLESDYVHHVIMKECDGFTLLYNHIRDALLLKNAEFFTNWETEKRHQRESYFDLTELALADILDPDDGSTVRVIAQNTREEPVFAAIEGQKIPLQDEATGLPLTQTYYDVEIRRVWEKGRLSVKNCVPEDFSVSMNHGSVNLNDADWCSYRMVKRKHHLSALGYSQEKIDEVPSTDAHGDKVGDTVQYAREDVERTATALDDQNETMEKSLDFCVVTYIYIRIDMDRDGIPEQYIVVLGGENGEVLLSYEEVSMNPFSASTPFIRAHKFYGESIYDKLVALTIHKTKVVRMLEDNLDRQNNPTKKARRGASVLSDLMSREVGGVWRVDDMNAVDIVQTPPINQQAAALLTYYDKVRSERTGADPNAQSISNIMPEESMNHAMERVLSMKEEVVGLIVRVFAETGVKDMFLKARALLMQNYDEKKVVRLRNKWTEINPASWVERTNSTVVVGLGTGDKLRRTSGLQTILAIQKEAMAGGLAGILVSPERLSHTIRELVRIQGLGDPDDFVLDPSILADPRNAQTPRGQEMIRAKRMADEAQKQAQQQEMVVQQMQAQQQDKLYELQRQIEQMRAMAKKYDADKQFQSDMAGLIADFKQFKEEMTFKYAELARDSIESSQKLAIEGHKAQKIGAKAAERSEPEEPGEEEMS